MDGLNTWGVDVIIKLQRHPIFTDQPYSYFWILFTKLGDPYTIFVLHAPLLFVFLNEWSSFVKFFVASCISEFLNGVFKWALMADRPYWWIFTSGHSKSTMDLVKLRQFPPTCETGPGSPSGHCMITAAAWIILIYSRKSKLAKIVCILAYTVSLIILALSRLYIGTHFPHQVVLGALIGIIVGTLCYEIKATFIRFTFCLKIIAALTIVAIATYKTLLWLGYDPDWSIALALRYCQNAAWIHVSNTPFASLFRNTGSLLGLGIVAQWFEGRLVLKYDGVTLGKRVLGLVLSLIAAQVITRLPVLAISESLMWFYLCFFTEHALLFLSYTVFIPKMLGVKNKND